MRTPRVHLLAAATSVTALALAVSTMALAVAHAEGLAVRGRRVHTMAGPPLENGVVLVENGRIKTVGPAASTVIPDGWRVLDAAVVTPGLIDAHATVGLTGMLNQRQDQDQLESSAPIQPELRALDAYNPLDPLVAWVRGFGVTTLHTGHAPGQAISGQTIVVKTDGRTVEEALVKEPGAVAATLSPSATRAGGGSAPGTRGKLVAILRAELTRAQEYAAKREAKDPAGRPARDLRLEMLGRVLSREVPLMVTAHRAQDIDAALRLAREFGFTLWLDGASESYLLLDAIRAAKVPVILHPPMQRFADESENASLTTAAALRRAGIPFALQSGFESYVPKTRVVLFEASIAAAHGLTDDETLAAITIDAAKLLGIDGRVGSLAPGKDADLALFDGDPFEYTTHVVAVVIGGRVHPGEKAASPAGSIPSKPAAPSP